MVETAERRRVVTKIPADAGKSSRIEFGKRIKVAAYCRVSTDDEDQLNSYRVQKDYYTRYIANNEKWEYVDVYADEGITGTQVKKRDEFLRMIKDCEKGKIDMILTKSVSRFARNIVDSLSYVRKLKAMGIAIYFEEQNINSLIIFIQGINFFDKSFYNLRVRQNRFSISNHNVYAHTLKALQAKLYIFKHALFTLTGQAL